MVHALENCLINIPHSTDYAMIITWKTDMYANQLISKNDRLSDIDLLAYVFCFIGCAIDACLPVELMDKQIGRIPFDNNETGEG